jgi:hypothetical protein
MQPEHPFPGMPLPIPSKGIKPTTPTHPQTFGNTTIPKASPSLPTDPPSRDSRMAIVGSPYSDPPKKWIVVDHDGAETWFSGHDGAWAWFMASPLAVRIYLLTGGVRSLIGGLPYSPKPWTPKTPPRPFHPKFGVTLVCYTQGTIAIGVCRFEHGNTQEDKLFFSLRGFWDKEGWRFYPNQTIPEFTGSHKPGVKFHPTYKACIPAWATPLITKWVLVEGK